MGIDRIGKILENHNVPFYVNNGRIYADSMIAGTGLFEQVEDLTDCSRKKLYDWLGY